MIQKFGVGYVPLDSCEGYQTIYTYYCGLKVKMGRKHHGILSTIVSIEIQSDSKLRQYKIMKIEQDINILYFNPHLFIFSYFQHFDIVSSKKAWIANDHIDYKYHGMSKLE